MMNNQLFTIEEVCQWQKISRRTLERWREKGLPCLKVGSIVRFKKEEVQNWIELQSNLKEYLTDKSLIVVGPSGSGKTRNVVIPSIKQWNGVVLAYDLNGELLHSKNTENEIGIVDTDNNITKAIDSLKQGNSVYLLATFENKMKQQLEDILSNLVENNIDSPLLIVIEEYLSLDKLNALISLVRKSRVKNMKFLISISAPSEEYVKNMLKEQYGALGLTTIIENFDFIDMQSYKEKSDNNTNIIDEMTALLKNLNGMARTNCEMELKSFIDLKKSGKDVIIVDSKSTKIKYRGNENILIIGNLGSGAYLGFKHMLLKENGKGVLIDSFDNEDLIKKLEKNNIDSFFYKKEFHESRIIKDYDYNKFFLNSVNINIEDSDILSLKNLVLRIGMEDLCHISNVENFFSKFDKILIFSPMGAYIEKDRESLRKILPKNLKHYVDLFSGHIDEYILITNGCVVEYKKFQIPDNELEKIT